MSSADYWYVVAGEDKYGPAVASTWSGGGHFNQEANARMMAAAPALLSELQYLVEWIEANRRTIGGDFSMEQLLADPRAAIGKATGQ